MSDKNILQCGCCGGTDFVFVRHQVWKGKLHTDSVFTAEEEKFYSATVQCSNCHMSITNIEDARRIEILTSGDSCR